MQREWIRAKDIPITYGIGRTKAYGLLGEFVSQTDSKNYIRDGRILLVKVEQFETWWRNRGRGND